MRPVMKGPPREPPSLLGPTDLHLFNEGTHARLYDKLGSRLMNEGGQEGAYFAVWAPNAERVSVIGDFNGWDDTRAPLRAHGSSGIWEGFLPGVKHGDIYKYRLWSRFSGYRVDKADPFAVRQEVPPRTGSVVWHLEGHAWGDEEWMKTRHQHNGLGAPISFYEVHLGSWMRVPEDGNRSLSYREIAPRLAAHVKALGFTHVEIMPIMEHPFFGSWGYQVTGYFAPSARYGTPQDFMYLVDHLHREGIGVVLDWVPAHFPSDQHGLSYFDGTHLFEHADRRQGFHPDWKSEIFNYGRHEVRSFLISSATYWLDKFHVDGLRVDGVASMLYLDYGRQAGEWIPNEYGGHENLQAVSFLRQFNETVYREHPDVQTIAEESTAWPMVSRPTYMGGLGFGMKWDMGWMHDTLSYFARDPVHRRFHHNQLTFRGLYAFHENYVLPLSHDEVVHGKGSLLGKMAGDRWQKFANLRLLYSYMFAQPGKKLLFMGGEFAQWREWSHDTSLDWHLVAESEDHGRMQLCVGELNHLYRREAAMHELDGDGRGMEWVEANDAEYSVVAFLRKAKDERDRVLVVCNFTPVPRHNYRVGVDGGPGQSWREIYNSDATAFGGSGHGNAGCVMVTPVPWHGRRASLNLTVPPLGALFLKPE
jgi:1,4-alpha-glucan branching enzyme